MTPRAPAGGRCNRPPAAFVGFMATYGNEEWENVNGSTARLEVPGGWLYKVSVGGGQRPLLAFVSDLPGAISGAAFHLGTGNAATSMGAIEAHSVNVKEGAIAIADAISELATAIREHEADDAR